MNKFRRKSISNSKKEGFEKQMKKWRKEKRNN